MLVRVRKQQRQEQEVSKNTLVNVMSRKAMSNSIGSSSRLTSPSKTAEWSERRAKLLRKYRRTVEAKNGTGTVTDSESDSTPSTESLRSCDPKEIMMKYYFNKETENKSVFRKLSTNQSEYKAKAKEAIRRTKGPLLETKQAQKSTPKTIRSRTRRERLNKKYME
eukprot:CAMPEP_0118713804 /NCGR_PEP_ID=MMETSP0800-20121206/25754_1 /TAXON_ID=210618 ORGANISM="Striatella unipunctata, Strain CCMP2910" /NCGR_SAMPLE_ID=MMETSP0800 /ASSEMBLY_ACC=CAM_ASM_000638 /LENGTH=164 /DNA_ID=CAMNT_0006619365 /DNA_START=61 /DNA_END=555 /DNA_ORIENTATION=+